MIVQHAQFGGLLFLHASCGDRWVEGPRMPGRGPASTGTGAMLALGPDGRLYAIAGFLYQKVWAYGPRVRIDSTGAERKVFGGPFSHGGHVHVHLGGLGNPVTAEGDGGGQIISSAGLVVPRAQTPTGTELWIIDETTGFVVVAVVP